MFIPRKWDRHETMDDHKVQDMAREKALACEHWLLHNSISLASPSLLITIFTDII